MKQLFFSTFLLFSLASGLIAETTEEQNRSSYKAIKEKAATHNIQFFNATWSDMLGNLKELKLPISKLDSALEALFFDGSSMGGFKQIFESDLRLKLDPRSFWINSYETEQFPSMRIFCDILDTNGLPYENDPRSCLKKVIEEAKDMGYSCVCGTEIEFFLLKNDNNVTPIDDNCYCGIIEDLHIKKFTEELLYILVELGLSPEKVHHEVAPGQFEVVLEHSNPLDLADRIQLTKHIIKTLSKQYGFKATFMPKPIAGINGTGMHIHISLKESGENTFFDQTKECFLSDKARSFISGILNRAEGINVLLNSEVNSSKRLVPGYEAPVFLCCGDKNRSAAIRIPEITRDTLAKNKGAAVRIELRWPDPSCNPYLAFAAVFKAGLAGIQNNEAPTPFVNRNLYNESLEEIRAAGIKILPESLNEALNLFEESEFAKELLGQSLHASYLKEKRNEWKEYLPEDSQQISNWELKRGI